MADVKFRVVRQALRTTTGTQDFTSSGLGTPAAGIFLLSKAVTDDTTAADAALSIGFATDSTDEHSIQVYSEDGVGTANTYRDLNNNTVSTLISSTGGTDVVVAVSGTTTDGYTLDVLKADGNAYFLTAILIGGTDVANAYVGSYSPSSGGTDVTGPGFEPDLVFSGGVGNNTTTSQVHSILHFGVAHNTGAGVEQCGFGWWDEDNVATMDSGLYLDSDGLAGQTFNGASNWSHQLSDFDASGFTATGNAGSDGCYFLALKFNNGPDLKVFQESGPTATGSFSTTTPGFQPDFGLIISADLTAVDTVDSTDADGFSITAFDGTNQYATAISSDDGAATSAAKSLSYSGGIHLLEGGSTTLEKATFTSFDGNGWTFNYSTAPGTARKYIGLAIGPATGGGGTTVNVGLATDTESALSVTAVNPRTYSIGLVSESETALPVTSINPRSYSVGLVTDTETALTITPSIAVGGTTVALGIATDSESVLSITPSKTVNLGLSIETSEALSIAPSKTVGLGLAQETETALSVTVLNPRSYTVGIVTETETALPIIRIGGAETEYSETFLETVIRAKEVQLSGTIISSDSVELTTSLFYEENQTTKISDRQVQVRADLTGDTRQTTVIG